VYGPSIDPVVTSTPGIGMEEKAVATGSASGSSNTAAESTGLISPERKQKEYQTVDRAMGPWAGSLDLGTHRNYPRPYWTYTFDLYFSRDLHPLNSTSQIYLLLLILFLSFIFS
jgi:hypothetical protein